MRTEVDVEAAEVAETAGRLNALSATERQIVVLAGAGHTNDEIARRLLLSATAVEWSRTKIHRKLRAAEATCSDARVAAPDPSVFPSAAGGTCGTDPNEERA